MTVKQANAVKTLENDGWILVHHYSYSDCVRMMKKDGTGRVYCDVDSSGEIFD